MTYIMIEKENARPARGSGSGVRHLADGQAVISLPDVLKQTTGEDVTNI